MERTIATKIKVKVGERPADPMQEINTGIFLKALLGGPPARARAFRRLVEVLHAPLAGFIGRHLRDADLVQDVLQETFLAVHRNLPRFEERSKLTTWVYSLAYYKICDQISEKYRRGAEVPGSAEDWEPETAEPGVDELLHQTRLVDWIRSAAEELPELYREAYRLRDVDGLSGEAASEVLRITPGLIRVRLHRARSLIVEKVRKRYPAAFAGGSLI